MMKTRLRKIYSILPECIRDPARRLKKLVDIAYYYGNDRFCPVCEKPSRCFRRYGIVPREDAECVHCGALERHRLFWLYVNNKTDLFVGKHRKMLHIAPEPCFVKKLKHKLGDGYISADLEDPRANIKMDVTNIQYPDSSFDVICCSHVLEHVEDDRLAMKELFRVLDHGGWAILNVPITRKTTFEDSKIVAPAERLRTFGHEGHVRSYGIDFADRLEEAGFCVDTFYVDDIVESECANRMGLTRAAGEIFHCSKN